MKKKTVKKASVKAKDAKKGPVKSSSKARKAGKSNIQAAKPAGPRSPRPASPSLRQKLFRGGLITGAAASACTVVASLCLYYYPAVSRQAITSVTSFCQGLPGRLSDFVSEKISSDPDGQPASALNDANADAGAATNPGSGEDVPYMVHSREMGAIDDLGPEPGAELPDDQIYIAMLDTAAGSMLYYNQGDIRWGEYLYGGQDPMNRYGCGPTAVAMIINSFTDSYVTPPDLADWASSQGYYAPQSGSYHSLIPRALEAYGLSVESVKDRSYENVSSLLNSGHLLVALMGRGSLTQNGHFVIFTKQLENGNIYIADPNSYSNSTKEWDLNQLLSELKNSRDSGAPLWAVLP